MSKMMKNKGMFAAVLAAVFMLIIASAASAAAFIGPDRPIVSTPETSGAGEEIPEPSEVEELPSDPGAGEGEGSVITTPMSYNKPSLMRGVYLIPGVDFLTSADASAATVKSQIEKAINTAKSYNMNAIIIDTTAKDKVLYKTDLLPTAVTADFDPLQYAITYARGQDMYVYTIFDALLYFDNGTLVTPPFITSDIISAAVANAEKLAADYRPDGVLLDGYYNKNSDTSYSAYLKSGGAMGFENYMKNVPDSLITNISNRVHKMAPGVQLGLLTDEVWENKLANEAGSDTTAAFCALSDGNADTKRYIESGLFDFITVRAYGSLTDKAVPFVKVVKWWADLANKNNLPFYVVQASDRIMSSNAGWGEKDQIVKQVIEAEKITGYKGSVFNNLPRLIENPSGARELLVKYLNKEIKSDFILTQLTFTKPAKAEYSTYEPTVNFTGASDPNEKLLLDDKEITTDKNGFFNVSVDLKAGKNTFTFKHKDKTTTFNITRNVKVLKEMAPVGSITVNGGNKITITATAYEGSSVVAKINGTSVTLKQMDTQASTGEDNAENRESFYKLFSGEYTAPAAGGSTQSLGNITISATWQGISESLTGASVKVNKKVELTGGSPVVITSDRAETFPSGTLDDLSDPDHYPLAKGAKDYTVGDEIIYREGSSTYSYYLLASDRRVYSSAVSSTGSGPKDAVIRGMTVDADTNFTKVILRTDQNPSYTFNYSKSQISIEFHNTKTVPGSISSLTKNPLFSSATWNGTTLRLSLKNSNFLGYYAYYEGSDLVFRFNNPPTGGGVSGARILIDSGHGGNDPGALGYNPSYPEAYINAKVATRLTSKLTSMGASVQMVGNTTIGLDSRVAAGRSYNASVYVSIHCNSASASASGTEAYYFYPYGSPLSSSISSGVASALNTSNRGSKFGRYRVTRDSQFASVLAECGFVSNKDEYTKLFDSSYQDDIADAIASAIRSFYNGAGSGTSLTGVQSVGEVVGVPVTGVTLDNTTLTLAVGGTKKLTATIAPENATNKEVTWSSDNQNVATVAADGTITAKAVGTAKITVTTADGAKTAVCTVTVTAQGVTGVTLNKTSATIEVNKTEQLTATLVPDNAANKNVTWSSSNTAIATVDGNGLVKGVAPGTATITVTTADGGKTATCNITVTAAAVAVTGVSLPATATVEEGATVALTATIAPANATNQEVTWSSGNTNVATVAADGKVTGKAAGSAVITVTTKDGNKTATCTVTVTAAPVAVTGVQLPLTAQVEADKTIELTATITPSGATAKTVTWSSDNPAVATVGGTGKVTGIKAGVARITVNIDGKTAYCDVTVAPVSSSGETEQPSQPEQPTGDPSAPSPSQG